MDDKRLEEIEDAFRTAGFYDITNELEDMAEELITEVKKTREGFWGRFAAQMRSKAIKYENVLREIELKTLDPETVKLVKKALED